MIDLIELAEGLQHSNVKEISQLAKGFLALKVNYDELKHKYVMQSAEIVMKQHEKLFKRLAQLESEEEE